MDPFERDFFTDSGLNRDPAPYYAALRARGPVVQEPHHGVFMVSGIQEMLEVYADHESFSAVIAPLGPLVKLPEPAEGETLADLIEHRRDEIPLSGLLATFDPPRHTRHRKLLDRLFTPNRMRENEEFMRNLADRLIDEFVDRGEIDFCADYAGPFTMLVIADLLGVPEEDHKKFRGWEQEREQAFLHLDPYFREYVAERRASPRDDVLTHLATVRFPDGELPEVIDVVRIASFLFAAGQETTRNLLASGMRILAERPGLADDLRAHPEAIPNFVEECLRFESPIKGAFRLALRDTRLAGVDIPEGSYVMAMNHAAGRDPRVFEDPDTFDPRRANARRHLAFGHGEHFCPGATLARTEARISFERLLARLDSLDLVDPRSLSYMENVGPIRGLEALPLRFHRCVR